MNITYAPTAGGYNISEMLPSFLQEASPPTVQTKVAKASKHQANIPTLLGTTLSIMFVAGSAYALPPPTFIETTQYIYPDRVILESINIGLYGYQVENKPPLAINEYLKALPVADEFVRKVASIIDGIYGVGITRTLRVLDDLDTGKPIMELTIESDLPLHDEFIQKDKELFQQITASGLVEGLKYVVVSQG